MDAIYKTLLFDGKISLTVIESTQIVNKAIKYHGLTPLTSAVLGRTITASLFMASNLKNKSDRLSVTISGDGPAGQVIVSADSNLHVRGYVENPGVELPLNEKGKLDVSGAVGKGRLTVVRNMGLKEPYSGSSQIVSGEIAEDFAYYYTVSEQEPTAMALGVLTSAKGKCLGAGGVIMQALPGCDDETARKAEEIILGCSDVSSLIKKIGAQGICELHFPGVEFNYRKPLYKCVCSKKYINSMMIALGKEELYDIIREQGEIKVECEYCDKEYVYTKEDVDKLLGITNG